jgi:hypothetical protein
MSEGTFNPADRRLCPDGSCIGIVGSDGRCRVCGRAGDGSVAASAPARDAGQHDDDGDNDSLSAGEAESGAEAGGGTFRPDRRLCEDGSCVGVIGAGDVCTVCGRPAGS